MLRIEHRGGGNVIVRGDQRQWVRGKQGVDRSKVDMGGGQMAGMMIKRRGLRDWRRCRRTCMMVKIGRRRVQKRVQGSRRVGGRG